MSIQTLTKLALSGLIFAGLLFATGCGESPQDEAADAMEEAGDAIEQATE